MRINVTKKEIMKNYKCFSVGYCDLQTLLNVVNPQISRQADRDNYIFLAFSSARNFLHQSSSNPPLILYLIQNKKGR